MSDAQGEVRQAEPGPAAPDYSTAEERRIAEAKTEWLRQRGKRHPIVEVVAEGGLAQQLGIQVGDIYASYNGVSFAEVTDMTRITRAYYDAKNVNPYKVTVVFVRNDEVRVYQCWGGDELGVRLRLPGR